MAVYQSNTAPNDDIKPNPPHKAAVAVPHDETSIHNICNNI